MNSLNNGSLRGHEIKLQRLPSLRKMTFGTSVSSSSPEHQRSSVAPTAIAITNNNVSEGYYSPRSSFASVSSEESPPSAAVHRTFTRSPISLLQSRSKKTATRSYAFNPSISVATPRLVRTQKAYRNLRPVVPTSAQSVLYGPRLPIHASAVAPTKTTYRNPIRNPFRNAPANRNNGAFAMQNNPMHKTAKKSKQKRPSQTRKFRRMSS